MAILHKVLLVLCLICVGCNEAAVPAASSCPEGATLGANNQTCYLAGRGFIQFFEAYALCQSAGCLIAMPMDQAELDDLKTYAQTISMSQFWLGGVDHLSEGNFVRAGTGTNLTFINFKDGQPNGGDVENCLLVDDVSIGKSIDTGCAQEKPFICTCPCSGAGTLTDTCRTVSHYY